MKIDKWARVFDSTPHLEIQILYIRKGRMVRECRKVSVVLDIGASRTVVPKSIAEAWVWATVRLREHKGGFFQYTC